MVLMVLEKVPVSLRIDALPLLDYFLVESDRFIALVGCGRIPVDLDAQLDEIPQIFFF